MLHALIEVYGSNGEKLEVVGLGDTGELWVTMDPDNLASVVRNLIDNAIRHGKAAPKIDVRTQEAQVILTVADDGPGISPANAQRIFDPFFTTDREGGGTGLGLSLVKTLVEVHGGTIALADTDVGSQFVVTLPRAVH